MKHAWYYLQWKWKNMDAWDRWWALAMILLITGWCSPYPYGMWLNIGAFCIFAGGVLKLFWDMQVRNYRKYQEEQQKVINILKD